jgi:hypothetical protein
VNDDMLTAADISWTSDPLPRIELVPMTTLLALDAGELLAYTLNLLHEALGALSVATHQREHLQMRVRRLVEELRKAHEAGRVIGAQLRQLLDEPF